MSTTAILVIAVLVYFAFDTVVGAVASVAIARAKAKGCTCQPNSWRMGL
ncbi:hypothetical protein [Methylobacterium sp. Leaf112]|nr:hypothetical protein [Methylobacterium sp. Leaf112]